VTLQGNETTTPRMNAPSPARVAALDRLARQAGRFPDLEFVDMGGAPTVDGVALDGRDAALARAIEHMVAHRWMSLAAIARACVDRRWENVDARVQAALLAAGAQLFLFGNIADHAVVDDTVEWTKGKGHRGASGFVNAVLRRMIALRGEIIEGPDAAPRAWRDRNDLLPLSDGRAMRLTRPVFSSDRVLRVAEQVSVGEDLLLHWINAAGRDMAFDRAVHCLKPAPTIIAGLPDAAAAAGAPFAEHLAAHDERGFHVWKGDHASLVALLAAHPEARVQDAASAQPMRLADGLRPLLTPMPRSWPPTSTARACAPLRSRSPITRASRSPRPRDCAAWWARSISSSSTCRAPTPAWWRGARKPSTASTARAWIPSRASSGRSWRSTGCSWPRVLRSSTALAAWSRRRTWRRPSGPPAASAAAWPVPRTASRGACPATPIPATRTAVSAR
jgi:hypothetical protein